MDSSDHSEEVRLFIAIKVPPRPYLLNAVEQFKHSLQNSKLNWVSPNNFHVTLRFLGNTARSKIESLGNALMDVGKEIAPFKLHWNEPGFFGPVLKPKSIWYGFEEEKAITSIKTLVDQRLSHFGFETPAALLIPHLTIGRIKNYSENIPLNELISSIPRLKGFIQIRSIHLIQSILKKTGPEYISLKEIGLVK